MQVSERADANVGPHAANKATFDISGRTLVVASDDASLRTLDTLSMSLTERIARCQHVVDCLFSACFVGHACFTASFVGSSPSRLFGLERPAARARFVTMRAITLHGELRGHEDCALAVALDTSQKYLVSAGADQTFRIWS
jgi:WD40 repeat protein